MNVSISLRALAVYFLRPAYTPSPTNDTSKPKQRSLSVYTFTYFSLYTYQQFSRYRRALSYRIKVSLLVIAQLATRLSTLRGRAILSISSSSLLSLSLSLASSRVVRLRIVAQASSNRYLLFVKRHILYIARNSTASLLATQRILSSLFCYPNILQAYALIAVSIYYIYSIDSIARKIASNVFIAARSRSQIIIPSSSISYSKSIRLSLLKAYQ